MQIITTDGRRFDVKYQKNKESVTVDNQTAVSNYPNFIGSKIRQNSTSSDKYALTFAIHKNFYVELKESLKKIVVNEDDAIEDDEYGKLTHIILVHPDWGAIKGRIVGSIKYDTSSEADISASCVFQEHTDDEPDEKKDIEQENTDATEEVDEETEDGELEEEDRGFLLRLFDALKALYDKIVNSKVFAAFNDLKSAINDAILNYQKVMNAVKAVLELAAEVGKFIGDIKSKIDKFVDQAKALKNIVANTINQVKFSVNCLSFNLTRANRLPFERPNFTRQRSGLKVAPIN